MKKALFLFAFAAFSVAMQAQTSRKFTVNLTPDGAANMQVFLPVSQLPMSAAQNAIRTVRDSAEAWHVSPYDVGIMGFSAGGHLASTTATHAPQESRPDFQILFYPVISMDERVTHKGSVVGFLGDKRGDEKLVHEFSNDKQVHKHQTPPAIIIMAGDDRAVPPMTNGLPYYMALRKAGKLRAVPVSVSVRRLHITTLWSMSLPRGSKISNCPSRERIA